MTLTYGQMSDVVDNSRCINDLIWVNKIKKELKDKYNLDNDQTIKVLEDMYEHCLLPCKVQR